MLVMRIKKMITKDKIHCILIFRKIPPTGTVRRICMLTLALHGQTETQDDNTYKLRKENRYFIT